MAQWGEKRRKVTQERGIIDPSEQDSGIGHVIIKNVLIDFLDLY